MSNFKTGLLVSSFMAVGSCSVVAAMVDEDSGPANRATVSAGRASGNDDLGILGKIACGVGLVVTSGIMLKLGRDVLRS